MGDFHIRTLQFDDLSLLPLLYGERNRNLDHLEKKLHVMITDRGNMLSLDGPETAVDMAAGVLMNLWSRLRDGEAVTTADIDSSLRFAKVNPMIDDIVEDKPRSNSGSGDRNAVNLKRKPLYPRSPTQAAYIDALRKNELVFGIGPAGTGKTYLAVAMAVEQFEKKQVERMVFCRPAVEAGEKLGFLPGDMREKIDPYLRPIYDALYEFLGLERVEKMLERGEIEIAPLAFMRGRTLSHAYVVLDEAQNTTSGQMKMFLSRMGEGSRMVVNGDPGQIDLPPGHVSGLKEAVSLLDDVEEIAFIKFTTQDVVRHHLVGRILDAYEKKSS